MKSDTSSMVRSFENFVNNPISKKTISKATNYCEKCGASHLECALEYYLGIREEICTKCKLIVPIIKNIINKGLKSFDTSQEALINTMQDPYWRKGLISVIKGMGVFGINKPFVPAAPFQIV